MFSGLTSVATIFAGGVVFETAYQVGKLLRKRDIIEYFDRVTTRHNRSQVIDDLKKIEKGIKKYEMDKGWPYCIKALKMPTEDLEEFYKTVQGAIKEAESAEEISQIKQKIALECTEYEKVIYKNYTWNPKQRGFYYNIFAKAG